MPKFVSERPLNGWMDREDGKLFEAYFHISDSPSTGLYAMLYSYDDLAEHRDWNLLKNKRVRITVETID